MCDSYCGHSLPSHPHNPFYPSLSPSPHLNLPTPHPNHLAHILTTPAPYTPSPSFSTPRYSSRSPPLSLTPHPLYPLTILLHTSLLLRLTTPFPHPSPLTPYTPSPSPHQSSPILTTPHHSSPPLRSSPGPGGGGHCVLHPPLPDRNQCSAVCSFGQHSWEGCGGGSQHLCLHHWGLCPARGHPHHELCECVTSG